MRRRLVIMGIDGGTLDLIRPWAAAGKLPTLGRLLQQGVSGKLLSTTPPLTPPAWTSFQTGVNPGKHGIFDWYIRSEGSYRTRVIDSRAIRCPTLWEVISAQGKRVGVMHLPVSYPARPVNGFWISGMLTPPNREDFAFPQEVGEELRNVAVYPLAPLIWTPGCSVSQWIVELKNVIQARKRALLHFMEKYAWDALMVHFIESDIVQHSLWHTLAADFYRNPIVDVYQELDNALGEVAVRLDQDTAIMVVSDHGAGPSSGSCFHISQWLRREGYLVLKSDFATSVKKAAYRMGLTPEHLYPLGAGLYAVATRLGIRKIPWDPVIADSRQTFFDTFVLSPENVDWTRTRAYCYGDWGKVNLNLRGREPRGCVELSEKEALQEELIERLNRLVSPRTGKRVGRAFRREEIYWGGQLDQAPDLLFVPEDMGADTIVGSERFVSNKVFGPDMLRLSGRHRFEGVLAAGGKGFKEGAEITRASLVDLAPTILFYLGLSIPTYMDGAVLKELFTEEFLRHNAAKFGEGPSYAPYSARGTDLTEAEDAVVRKRLEELGYLG
ncbi:MAG: alkaline phosphatase family protein [Candidatus Rokubacteria bacterium]|nr:alkaline phosphatase family protein [Candidatus Rokubacteria bacterium]